MAVQRAAKVHPVMLFFCVVYTEARVLLDSQNLLSRAKWRVCVCLHAWVYTYAVLHAAVYLNQSQLENKQIHIKKLCPEDMGKPMTDSCWCLVEINAILQKKNYPSIKNK